MMNKDNENLIPKIIHYCWFGSNNPSEKMKNCINSWKKFLPDYEIKEWNDENIKNINSPYLDCAIKNKMWAFASDYIRFWALYNYGGVYLDTDVEVFKSFDSLLSRKFFIGLEMYSDGTSIGTATIGSTKKSKIVEDILKLYDNHNPIRNNGHFDYFSTSPKMLTNFIKNKYGYDFNKFEYNKNITEFAENCWVFPEIYFSANKYFITNYTYCKHHFAGNWGIKWQVKTLLNFENIKLHICKKMVEDASELPILDSEDLLFSFKLNNKKLIALVKVKNAKEITE